MENIEKLIKDMNLEKELIEIRREFHKEPEISGKEFKTGEKICALLDKWGIEHKKNVAETGIVAVINGHKQGKVIGIRADIDALPIQEGNTDKEYCSQNQGVMHACGHDAHITILLGAAKLLKASENRLAGTVKMFFQPAEETTGGAERMISEGCLENPHVDYVLGLHVEPGIDAGKVGIKYGKMYASSDIIDVEIKGKASHGAHPEQGTDAVMAAAHVLTALQTVASRNVGAVNSVICSFGKIRGGTVRNQIADNVKLEGILRTLDEETRLAVRERVEKICTQVAEALGAEAQVTVYESYGPLINNDEITDIVFKNAEELLGSGNVIKEKEPDLSTEDFAYFAKARPSCYFHLGCGEPGRNDVPVLHNQNFDIDESCLLTGVRLQVKNVLTLLEK